MVIARAVESADSWKKKKAPKSCQVVNLFVKAARILEAKGNAGDTLREQATLLIKVIEKECQRDKALSNLKGKVKEIRAILKLK